MAPVPSLGPHDVCLCQEARIGILEGEVELLERELEQATHAARTELTSHTPQLHGATDKHPVRVRPCGDSIESPCLYVLRQGEPVVDSLQAADHGGSNLESLGLLARNRRTILVRGGTLK